MGIIFDTSVWVALSAASLDRSALEKWVGGEALFTSAISLGELYFGVEACASPAERAVRSAFLQQIETWSVLEVTRKTAVSFGILAASVKQSGRSPRPRYNDLWIAAQAIEHGHALLTLNPVDFAKLPGLRVLTLPQARRS